MNEIYRTYRDRVDFYVIYIKEIHPTDGWQVQSNGAEEVLYAQPTTTDERAEVAQACVLRLNFEMPMLLDEMSNAVDEAYAALPERLYLVDAAGNVVWRCGPGPFGFDVDGWEEQIKATLGAG